MSPRAADQLLEGKVKLGGAASSSAGPVGTIIEPYYEEARPPFRTNLGIR
jgi:hypothetical protein